MYNVELWWEEESINYLNYFCQIAVHYNLYGIVYN